MEKLAIWKILSFSAWIYEFIYSCSYTGKILYEIPGKILYDISAYHNSSLQAGYDSHREMKCMHIWVKYCVRYMIFLIPLSIIRSKYLPQIRYLITWMHTPTLLFN